MLFTRSRLVVLYTWWYALTLHWNTHIYIYTLHTRYSYITYNAHAHAWWKSTSSMKFPFDQSHHLRAVGRLFAEGGRLGAVSASGGSERLVGIRRWIISLVSIPTHYCMFLLFLFVFVYRRRIYWGTMLLRIRRHEILLKMAGSRHLPWSLNWKSWGIIWQIPSRPASDSPSDE